MESPKLLSINIRLFSFVHSFFIMPIFFNTVTQIYYIKISLNDKRLESNEDKSRTIRKNLS